MAELFERYEARSRASGGGLRAPKGLFLGSFGLVFEGTSGPAASSPAKGSALSSRRLQAVLFQALEEESSGELSPECRTGEKRQLLDVRGF